MQRSNIYLKHFKLGRRKQGGCGKMSLVANCSNAALEAQPKLTLWKESTGSCYLRNWKCGGWPLGQLDAKVLSLSPSTWLLFV